MKGREGRMEREGKGDGREGNTNHVHPGISRCTDVFVPLRS